MIYEWSLHSAVHMYTHIHLGYMKCTVVWTNGRDWKNEREAREREKQSEWDREKFTYLHNTLIISLHHQSLWLHLLKETFKISFIKRVPCVWMKFSVYFTLKRMRVLRLRWNYLFLSHSLTHSRSLTDVDNRTHIKR